MHNIKLSKLDLDGLNLPGLNSIPPKQKHKTKRDRQEKKTSLFHSWVEIDDFRHGDLDRH